MVNFADRLVEAIKAKGTCACVGLDPRPDRMPRYLRGMSPPGGPVGRFGRFCRELIEAVAPHVAVLKIQIAFFESLGARGFAVYRDCVRWARREGLVVIGDVKRGDIGATSEAYAAAHLSGPGAPDAVTVNPLFGTDGVEPFLEVARAEGRGVFILTRTSNPSATELQDFPGRGLTLSRRIAELVRKWGEEFVSASGYSAVGAVVGGTYPREVSALRRGMPHQFLLIPGLGAQGAEDAAVRAGFNRDGLGALPSASRSVIYAFQTGGGRPEPKRWQEPVERAARDFARQWPCPGPAAAASRAGGA